MGLIRRLRTRLKNGWRAWRKERLQKKARKTPLKAVIYLAPYEHLMPEMATELELHGVKTLHYKVPAIKQRNETVEVNAMPSKEAVEFARSKGITFKLKGKGKA